MKTSKVIKNKQTNHVKDKLPLMCLKCISKCAKDDAPSCIAYEQERYHWHRMMDGDCPLIDNLVDNIFNSLVHDVRREMARRGNL